MGYKFTIRKVFEWKLNTQYSKQKFSSDTIFTQTNKNVVLSFKKTVRHLTFKMAKQIVTQKKKKLIQQEIC